MEVEGGRPGPTTLSAPSGEDYAPLLHELGIAQPCAVVVVIGGAVGLSSDGEGLSPEHPLRIAVDRGLRPAVALADAVVLTGGTDVGLMRVVGEVLGSTRCLIGVAPRSCVRVASQPGGNPDEQAARPGLEAHHDFAVLTDGETWGAETPVLVRLAEALRGGERPGLVVLGNGGTIARHETLAFLDRGWPVVTLDGSGREADKLAAQADPRIVVRGVRLVAEILGRKKTPFTGGWGKAWAGDVEVHNLAETPELLQKRLSWRLSEQRLLKSALTTQASYDAAAQRAQRNASRLQWLILGLSGLLVAATTWTQGKNHEHLRNFIVALPVALAVATTLTDSLVPLRSWLSTRAASEAIARSVYRYRGGAFKPGRQEADFASTLAAIERGLARSGVQAAVVPAQRGRPAMLGAEQDEFAPLTVDAYRILRLQGQRTYYRRSATTMRRRQVASIAGTAVLAAIAAAVAGEKLAKWVPLLVFAATAVSIVQQRARWQDKIRIYDQAVIELESIERLFEVPGTNAGDLTAFVNKVERVLAAEQRRWIGGAFEAGADSDATPFV